MLLGRGISGGRWGPDRSGYPFLPPGVSQAPNASPLPCRPQFSAATGIRPGSDTPPFPYPRFGAFALAHCSPPPDGDGAPLMLTSSAWVDAAPGDRCAIDSRSGKGVIPSIGVRPASVCPGPLCMAASTAGGSGARAGGPARRRDSLQTRLLSGITSFARFSGQGRDTILLPAPPPGCFRHSCIPLPHSLPAFAPLAALFPV